MSNKFYFSDLRRRYVQFQMTALVRRFFPHSWWQWLTAGNINTLYDFLVNKPFGEYIDRLGIMFGLGCLPDDGVCTFVNVEGRKGLLAAWVGGYEFLEWPEWGLGVYKEVCSYLTVAVSKTADPWNERTAAMWESLEYALLQVSRGCRVFEALGILGGVWSPAGGVAPNEKALDNLN